MYDAAACDHDRINDALLRALDAFTALQEDADDTEESYIQIRQCIVSIIALFCMRITMGHAADKDALVLDEELKEDIDDLCGLVDLFEPEGRFNAKRTDAYDLLSLFPDAFERDFKPLFSALEPVPHTGVRDVFFDLATDVALWLLHNDYTGTAQTVLSDLLALVYDRTEENLFARCEMTLEILTKTAELCPDWVFRQFGGTADLFDTNGEASLQQCGDYYWAMATALRKTVHVEEAEDAYAKCAAFRRQLYGPETILTWLPLQQRAALRVARIGSAADARILSDFIARVDAHAFPEFDPELEEIAVGESLYSLLTYYYDYSHDLSEHYPQVERFDLLCRHFDDRPSYPILKIRLAENIYACYYQQCGDLLHAEQHLLTAMEASCPKQTEDILPTYILEFNSLYICWLQNDPVHSAQMAASLRTKLEQGIFGEDDPFYYRGWAFLLCYEATFAEDPETLQAVQSETLAHLVSLLDRWQNNTFNVPVLTRRHAELAFVSFAQILLRYNAVDSIPVAISEHILEIVKRIYAASRSTDQRLAFFSWMLILLSAMKLKSPDAISYAGEFESRWKSFSPANLMGYHTFVIGSVFAQAGDHKKACALFRQSLDDITLHWHNATRYLNDQRLVEYLDTAQEGALLYYGALCDKISVKERYLLVLQHKAMAALAGRERNKILASASIDPALLNELHDLQDRVAILEKDAEFNDVSSQLEALKKRLSFLESEAARFIPQANCFTTLSVERVAGAMPEKSAVLEYFLHPSYGTPECSDGTWTMDLFVLVRHDRKASVSLCRLDEIASFSEAIERFMELANDENTYSDVLLSEEFETLRLRLYDLFFAPAMPYMEGVKRLYIAPDTLLHDFPYSLLGRDSEHLIGNLFSVVQLICGRDLLFDAQNHAEGTGSLVVGDPLFSILPNRDTNIADDDTPQKRYAKALVPLPFSALEARRVAQLCNAVPLVGPAAVKSCLLRADNVRVLHLATHGSFDMVEDSSALYTACLYFAGAADHMRTGSYDAGLGNGILTADEISRLDLHSVQVAVLSACCSGRTEKRLDCVQGLVAAFAAAGVKYVITSLWEANDCATALLMDFFYQAWCNGTDCPEALQRAKECLQSCTVKMIRDLSWMKESKDAAVRRFVGDLLMRRDTMKPFADPQFWGGFVCHQCRT